MSGDINKTSDGFNEKLPALARRDVLKSVGAAGAFGTGLSRVAETASATSHPTYSNPVIEPTATATAFIEVNGTYWAYGGEKCWGNGEYQSLPIWSSTDLYNWTFEGTAFGTRPDLSSDPSSGDPTWKYNGDGIWAPDIYYHRGNDQYILYYSLHGPNHDDSAIGAATSNNPDGPWTDQGKVVGGTNNSIDPDVVEHDGTLYMFFGSYSSPMHVTELTSDGLSDTGNWTQIAREGTNTTGFEAPHVVERNGYFYLFCQNQICCQGKDANPPYATVIARADSITGPYRDKEGRDMNAREAETEIRWSNPRFRAPGHGYTITGPDGDRWWLGEAYDTNEYDRTDCANGESSWRRPMMLDKVEWEDGWPTIRGTDNTPTRSTVAPDASDTTRPEASATASPVSATVGETITFDASNSYDADSGIDSYTWFLADGTVKHGETISHSYDGSGDYPVMLEVEDGVDLTDKDFVTITVDEPADSFLGNHLWTLNDGSGSTATDSVGGADGTVSGATWIDDAVQGGGLSFDGTDDQVTCGTNLLDTSGSFSVAAWVRLDSHGNGWQTAICQEGTNVAPFYLQYSNDIERFTLNVKASDSNGAASLKAQQASRPVAGRWYHLVGVHDANANEIRFYVDGRREAALNYADGWDAGGTFAIGRGYWDGSPADYWGGDIDHVQTFSRALTDAQANYVATHVDHGEYHVEPVHAPGKAVETAGGGTSDGDNVQQWEYNDFPTQKWLIESLGDGTYRLENANSGKYLEVAGGGTSDGDTVQQWSWNDGDHQKWRLEHVDDGEYRAVNVNSGKVLEVAGADATNGANVQQWSWNGGDWQRFELNKL
jgi:arabinan endo-1,5-alpha-L-arabinosidase